MLDLDARQRTVARYLENRGAFAAKRDLALPSPDCVVIADGPEGEAELAMRLEQASGLDFIVIDTPGRDSPLARAMLKKRVDDDFEATLPDGPQRFFIVGVEYG